MPTIDIFVPEAITTYSAATPKGLTKKAIDGDDLLDRLNKLLGSLNPGKIFGNGLPGANVESVTINVGISVQGGITVVALATVGVDASISVTLRPK